MKNKVVKYETQHQGTNLNESPQSNRYHFSGVPREKLLDPRAVWTTGVCNQCRRRVKILYIRPKFDHRSEVDFPLSLPLPPSLSSNLPSPGEQLLSTLCAAAGTTNWPGIEGARSYAPLTQPDWFRCDIGFDLGTQMKKGRSVGCGGRGTPPTGNQAETIRKSKVVAVPPPTARQTTGTSGP